MFGDCMARDDDEYLDKMEKLVREMKRLVAKEEEMTRERYDQLRYLHEEHLEPLADELGVDDDYEDGDEDEEDG